MAGIVKEKTCVDCEKTYEPTSNVQKRCPDCKEEHLKAKQPKLGGGRKKKKKREYTKRHVQEPASPGERTVEGSLGGMVRKAQTLISEIKVKCAELETLFE
ncbi:MAG TPA: hypothetical protein ENH31_00460 [Nitrospirae bacterium]|nr:hypothetical protein [Nitrospirota bacterium]HDK41417.1 hypothetical protein [Nitrospirota bacterium]HDK81024.1 hypothetical protein [Nitrospirota bacterium]